MALNAEVLTSYKKIDEAYIDELLKKEIEKNNKIKASIRFKGRQLAHTELGEEVLKRFAESLSDVSEIEMQPRLFIVEEPEEVLHPTSCISNGVVCGVFRRSASHQVHRILTGKRPVIRHYLYT